MLGVERLATNHAVGSSNLSERAKNQKALYIGFFLTANGEVELMQREALRSTNRMRFGRRSFSSDRSQIS